METITYIISRLYDDCLYVYKQDGGDFNAGIVEGIKRVMEAIGKVDK